MKKIKLLSIIMLIITVLSACGDEVYEGRRQKDNKENKELAEEVVKKEEVVPVAVAPSENEIIEEIQDDENISDEEQNSDSSNDSENHEAIEELVNQKNELINSDNVVEKTIGVYDINKQIAELNRYDFSDTTITFIGDSLTFGQGGDYNEYNNRISYVDYVRDILGCKTNNLAVAGATIGSYNGYDGIVYKADLIPEDTDIIVIFGGVNDYFYGKDLFGDESYSEGTFTGDTKKLFSTVRTRFPDKSVYVILVYDGRYEVDNENLLPLSEYMQIERDLASQVAFEVIDLNYYNLMNNNEFDLFAKYFSDEIHLNNDGYMWLGRYVAAEIVQDFN